ncbi:MAG: hypothetical protein ACTSXZ_11275 [Alphaproteobacteria bacterium]
MTRLPYSARTPLIAALFVLAACGPDMGRIALCEQVVHQLIGPADSLDILEWLDDVHGPHTITAVYRKRGGTGEKRRLVRQFADGGEGGKRLGLTGVLFDDARTLSRASFTFLKLQLVLP